MIQPCKAMTETEAYSVNNIQLLPVESGNRPNYLPEGCDSTSELFHEGVARGK